METEQGLLVSSVSPAGAPPAPGTRRPSSFQERQPETIKHQTQASAFQESLQGGWILPKVTQLARKTGLKPGTDTRGPGCPLADKWTPPQGRSSRGHTQ